MSHSGSISLGHAAWNVFEEKLVKDYPKNTKNLKMVFIQLIQSMNFQLNI